MNLALVLVGLIVFFSTFALNLNLWDGWKIIRRSYLSDYFDLSDHVYHLCWMACGLLANLGGIVMVLKGLGVF